MGHGYTYEGALAASEGIRWRVEDIIGGDKRLDFTKHFMPESLARVERLTFLTPGERLKLNQIRGGVYLCIFGLVEEFILPFVLDHAKPQSQDDDYRVRALLRFAEEEAKHIHLFKQFRAEFERGFGTRCEVIGPPAEVARAVLAHDPLGVGLAVLHIEWMTQRHYTESVKDDGELDPQFKSLLRHHWMEEAQHAKLDTLLIEAMAEGRKPEEVEHAVDDYLDIGGFIDQGLRQQVEFDLDAFAGATGRKLDEGEQDKFREVQLQANRWTYLGTAMTHETVLKTLEGLSLAARVRVEVIASAFC